MSIWRHKQQQIWLITLRHWQFCYCLMNTSPVSHFVHIQASPAGLLGRFAPLALCARILGRFAPSHFALRAHKNFQPKKVSQSTQNGLKRVKMQKKNFYAFDRLRASRVAQSAIGEAQPYLPHVTRRVPRSVHAKFLPTGLKLWALEGYRQTEGRTELF